MSERKLRTRSKSVISVEQKDNKLTNKNESMEDIMNEIRDLLRKQDEKIDKLQIEFTQFKDIENSRYNKLCKKINNNSIDKLEELMTPIGNNIKNRFNRCLTGLRNDVTQRVYELTTDSYNYFMEKNYPIRPQSKDYYNYEDLSQNIIVTPFGSEDLTGITTEQYIKMMNNPISCVNLMIKYIHFNRDKPQDQNIALHTIDNEFIAFHGTIRWQMAQTNVFIEDLYQKYFDLLRMKYEENIDDIKSKLSHGARKKFDNIEMEIDNEKLRETNLTRLKLLIYNEFRNWNGELVS